MPKNPDEALLVILSRLLVTHCWGKLQRCSANNPSTSMARASHHTMSHDTAPHSLATWHQCRGGRSSPTNSSKILHHIFQSSLCAHHVPGHPRQWWVQCAGALSWHVLQSFTQHAIPAILLFEWRFNAKSFADTQFHREHFYLCHKKADETFHFIISNTSLRWGDPLSK